MYEYKFVRVNYVGFIQRKLENYQQVILENARDGWRFVQAVQAEELDKAFTGVDLVFEREIPKR